MPRIVLRLTPGEWEAIDQKVRALGRKNMDSHLRSEILKLRNKFHDCPRCITPADGYEMKRKEYRIDEDSFLDLQRMGALMNRYTNTVVHDLIVIPLLYGDIYMPG